MKKTYFVLFFSLLITILACNKNSLQEKFEYYQLPEMTGTFKATPLYKSIKLDWQNPDSPVFLEVRIYRSNTSYPTNLQTGTFITRGNFETFTDTNVSPGTHYYYTLFACNQQGKCTVGGMDNAMPFSILLIKNFQAERNSGNVILTWAKPVSDTDYAGVKIIRKTGSFPSSVTDGNEICDSTGTTCTDPGIPSGTFYYAAFSYDKTGTYTAIPAKVTTQPSNNANLSSLALTGITLNQTFNPDVTGPYTASTDIQSTTINVTLADTNASYTVKRNSITLSNPFYLYANTNTIEVTVTAEDAVTQKTYTVEVSKTPWTKQIGTGQHDYSSIIITDINENIILTGMSSGPLHGETNIGGDDIFIIKYDNNSERVWTKLFGSPHNDSPYDVAIDNNGNIYLTGKAFQGFEGNSEIGIDDIIILKVNASGQKQWAKQLGVTGKNSIGSGIIIDSNNLFITGYTNGELGSNPDQNGSVDIIIAKYDTDGNQIWIKQYGTEFDDYSTKFSIDNLGNLYIVGYTTGAFGGCTNQGGNDVLILKIDNNGNLIWAKQFGTSEEDYAKSIKIDNSNVFYITGYTYGNLDGNQNQGNSDQFIVKYNQLWNKEWTKQWDDGMFIDIKNSFLYITKKILNDYYFVRIDSNGNEINLEKIQNYKSGNGTISSNSFIYIFGTTQFGESIDGNTNFGGIDFFVRKYDINGNQF